MFPSPSSSIVSEKSEIIPDDLSRTFLRSNSNKADVHAMGNIAWFALALKILMLAHQWYLWHKPEPPPVQPPGRPLWTDQSPVFLPIAKSISNIFQILGSHQLDNLVKFNCATAVFVKHIENPAVGEISEEEKVASTNILIKLCDQITHNWRSDNYSHQPEQVLDHQISVTWLLPGGQRGWCNWWRG